MTPILLRLSWGYKTPNPVHLLGHLCVRVDRIGGIGKWVGGIKLHETPKLTYLRIPPILTMAILVCDPDPDPDPKPNPNPNQIDP